MTTERARVSLDSELLGEVREVASQAGLDVDSFVDSAVRDKLSALRPDRYFRARAARSDIGAARAVLARAGVGNPPQEGDGPAKVSGE